MKVRLVVAATLLFAVAGCDCGKGQTGGGGGGGQTGGGSANGGGNTGGGNTGGGSTNGGGTGGAGGGSQTGGGSGGGGMDGGCGLVTCQSANANCGPVGDGCGATLDCGSCTLPQSCGGGGVPSQCGGDAGCVARTCMEVGANCGPVADGCGGLLNCGVCPSGQSCGGGGINNRCGVSGTLSDAGTCLPRDCADAGANCGPVGDGCGGLIASCGMCQGLDFCGGGGVPSQCGHTVTCTPRNCQQANATCGTIGDGCGATISCGSCNAPQSCGGGGVPNQCGQPACSPLSCAQLGANCGQQGDGCGGVTNSCGTCTGGTICGGAGIPNVCGNNVPDSGVCVNLCLQQAACDAGTTTISGFVVAPTNPALGYGQPDPVVNALVYVPNAPVQGFDAGVSCDQCGSSVSGKPLVSTYSAVDGGFVLTNAPCGTNIPLVIQLGRWRRQITIPNVQCCTDNKLSSDQTHLPRNKSEGDIPLIAVVTGSADPIECVLPKIGIDTAEFTNPGGGGRVNFFRDNGSRINNQTPASTSLYDFPATLANYDALILDCVGSEVAKNSAELQNMQDYTTKGGRVFMSHYGYVWLTDKLGTPGAYVTQTSPFPGVANWAPQSSNPSPQTGLAANIDMSFPKGLTFAQWLVQVGSSTTLGNIAIDQTRYDFTSVIAPPSQQWVYRPTNIPVEFTFNTPLNALPQNQCGRVLFSDFHVNTGGGVGTFPASCNGASPLTPQEKVLEYLLFDLTSCVTPDIPPPPMCAPTSCSAQGFMCGQQGDGCGNLQNCGSCPASQFCINGHCQGCTPTTCGALGFNCGMQADGCGGLLNCGMCTPPQTCGGGGTPGVCGGGACIPLSCTAQGFNCGMQGDGCGNTQDCGMCPPGQICGAGGPGVCGSPGCTPQTCQQQGLSCGPAGDGCGNLIQCGTCSPPDTCGGGGTPGMCGHPNCTPTTCTAAGANCGTLADGCGGVLNCGACTAPDTCGGGGLANVCGSLH